MNNGEFAYNKSYSKDYPWGAIKRLDNYEKGVLSTLYILFQPTKVNSDFLVSYYDTNGWHKEVSMRAAEGARNHGLLNITAQDFFDTELRIPKEENEQKRIGTFFRVLDDTIALHQHQLSNVQKMKAVMLKKMFPRDGEKIPEIRFPGFTEDWEQRKFSDFTKLSQGLQIAISNRYTLPGENRMFYITNEFLNPQNTKKYYIENPSPSVIANEEDILMTRTGNTGKVVTGVRGAFHNNFFKIAYKKDETSRLFLYYLLTSSKLQREMLVRAGTSTIPDLNHNDFYKIKVAIPIFEEQEAIGVFFQRLDTTIALHQHTIFELTNLKKSFLQKMFI